LGIELARGSFNGAWNCFLPILACIFGSMASEWVKHHEAKGQDWRVRALLLETTALFVVSFVPASVPDVLLNTTLSFITGFQLCLFRTSRWGAHNTTICTGNLRTVGQFLYGAFHDRTRESWVRLIDYVSLVTAFVLGAAVGVPICLLTGSWAALAGCLLCAVLTGVLAGAARSLW
jgi:uncharacterized membrane protein YoaK (UPF0700 family)